MSDYFARAERLATNLTREGDNDRKDLRLGFAALVYALLALVRAVKELR